MLDFDNTPEEAYYHPATNEITLIRKSSEYPRKSEILVESKALNLGKYGVFNQEHWGLLKNRAHFIRVTGLRKLGRL